MYLYIVYKSLRFFSLVCLLALGSNLAGNFVWACMDKKVSVNLSSEEDDNDPGSDNGKKNNSSKRGINLLEEELHLAENTTLSPIKVSPIVIEKASFSLISGKTKSSEKAPLENPPEALTKLS